MVTDERKIDSEMEDKTEEEKTRCKITLAGDCGNVAFKELCGIYEEAPSSLYTSHIIQ